MNRNIYFDRRIFFRISSILFFEGLRKLNESIYPILFYELLHYQVINIRLGWFFRYLGIKTSNLIITILYIILYIIYNLEVGTLNYISNLFYLIINLQKNQSGWFYIYQWRVIKKIYRSGGSRVLIDHHPIQVYSTIYGALDST